MNWNRLVLYNKHFKLQEEEIDDLAGQVQLLEQSKIKLEMSMAATKKEHRREMSLKVRNIVLTLYTFCLKWSFLISFETFLQVSE